MRTQELSTLISNIEALGLTVPTDVTKYREYLDKLGSIRANVSTGNRELQGIDSVDDIEAEIDKRTDDVLRTSTKIEQVRLVQQSVDREIEVSFINATEDYVDALRPIVIRSHDTVMKAADKLGAITTEAAVKTNDVKSYEKATEAYQTMETAHAIRLRLHALDPTDIDRQVLRRCYTWRFESLAAWHAYDRLGNSGSPISNHVATARTNGIELEWLSTDDAEAQSRALGKAQNAEARGDDAGIVFDRESMVYRTGSKAWMHL